jgi:hypothetical protein
MNTRIPELQRPISRPNARKAIERLEHDLLMLVKRHPTNAEANDVQDTEWIIRRALNALRCLYRDKI